MGPAKVQSCYIGPAAVDCIGGVEGWSNEGGGGLVVVVVK